MTSLPESQHGEPPSRLDPRGDGAREGGELQWEREEIIRFGQGEDSAKWYEAKRYAIVRYREFRTPLGKRFEVKAWVRPRVDMADRPYPPSPYNEVHIYVEPERDCAWLGPKGMIIMAVLRVHFLQHWYGYSLTIV